VNEKRGDNVSMADGIKGDDAGPSLPHAFTMHTIKTYRAFETPSNGQPECRYEVLWPYGHLALLRPLLSSLQWNNSNRILNLLRYAALFLPLAPHTPLLRKTMRPGSHANHAKNEVNKTRDRHRKIRIGNPSPQTREQAKEANSA